MSDNATPMPAGVRFNAPPPDLIGPISAAVDRYAESLRWDEQGGVVGIVTTTGVNGAIVQRIGGHVTIVGWLGKEWGQPIAAGCMWKVRW
jgi:hypothetical protein